MIYLLITTLLREMSQSGMCFYLFLQWMSTDFRNLHDAPGALLQHYASMYVVGGRKLGRRFSMGRIIFSAFCVFCMPPINFYVIL